MPFFHIKRGSFFGLLCKVVMGLCCPFNRQRIFKWIRQQLNWRNAVILLFLAINVTASALTGFFSITLGSEAVDSISTLLEEQYSTTIRQRTIDYMDSSFTLTQATGKAMARVSSKNEYVLVPSSSSIGNGGSG